MWLNPQRSDEVGLLRDAGSHAATPPQWRLSTDSRSLHSADVGRPAAVGNAPIAARHRGSLGGIFRSPREPQARRNMELLDAAARGDVTELDRLLGAGADINARSGDRGRTVLHKAFKHIETDSPEGRARAVAMVGRLLEHGARLDIADNERKTPVSVAIKYERNFAGMEDLLTTHGVDVAAAAAEFVAARQQRAEQIAQGLEGVLWV